MNGSFGINTNRYNARVSDYRGYHYGPIAGTVAMPPAACCGKPITACACASR